MTLNSRDGEYFGQLHVTEWSPNGKRDRGFAWVVSYLDPDSDEPLMLEREVEYPANSADSPERKEELVRKATLALESEPPALLVSEPRKVPLDADEWYQLIDLQISAWDAAKGRLHSACRSTEEWATDRIYVALSETLAWTYTIDESLQTWWTALPRSSRETLSAQTDQQIERLLASDRSDLTTEKIESDGYWKGYRERLLDGEPYGRWCELFSTGWFNRDTSNAFQWLRGQLTHTAVGEPVHLVQFRDGAEPRWKWAYSTQFTRSKEAKAGARTYNRELAGSDVLGLFAHFLDEFWNARSDLFRAMRETED